MIKLENISKTYKSKNSIDTNALKDINISFDNKGLVFIVGKSGSGKSTLLNLIGSLDTPDKGSIYIEDEDLCKLSVKQLESYRNTYVGFVFQEFNLLEEFNVYENINLSLKLNKQDNKDLILKTLESVDLKGLENRNINELSGGQKQRVSLARAIIKNPKLILADEPTGNLDKKSSNQVMNILKNISKDCLVIVVSHDIESAQKYADRIIRIEDGEVVSDNKKHIKNISNKIDFKTSNLPFNYIFKMAYSYIMSKPIRLVLTILLTMISLSFMCFSINTYLFKDNSLLINTMKDNNEYNLKIEHIDVEIKDEVRNEKRLDFDINDINNVENVVLSTSNPVYLLYENGDRLRFTFGSLSEELLDNDAYNVIPSNFKFVILNDKRIVSNIIGEFPSNNNEVLIHKYLADTIINAGIYDENNSLFKPSSYDEIIKSKRIIKLGNTNVIISGIVDDDTSLYQRAFKYGTFWNDNLKRYYIENYLSYSSYIYVTKDFIDNIKLSNNYNLSKMMLSYNNNNINDNIKIIDNNIKYIDFNGNEKITSSLNDNEIIISLETFKNIVNNYQISLDDYIKSHSDMVYNDIVKHHLKQFLKNTNINNNISFINTSNESEEKVELKIIGINTNSSYISEDIIGKNNSKKIIDSLIIYQDDKDVLQDVFTNFDVLYTYNYFGVGEKYRVSYDNSSNVSSVIYVYSRIKKFLLVTSLIFVLFSLLLIYNFISNSIDSYRKQIGILRSIGTRNIDIIKIFIIESLLIGGISWLFGTVIWLIECYVMNNSIFGSFYFKLNGIVINPISSIIVLIFDILLSILLTISVINKINKIKPIDVILNKY